VLEQVTYVRGGPSSGEDGWQQRPCVIDVPADASSFGFYAMPTPGIGYKVGLDDPLRDFDPHDLDRSPDSEREREALDRVRLDLPGLDSTLVRSEVCTWTDSADGQFILDRLGDIVIGCGDSGQGFKFHPLFGEVIADLAEGKPGHPDTVGFSVSRFG
jgi:glycine/D-amino acid oxidase-like deaminating enzyme